MKTLFTFILVFLFIPSFSQIKFKIDSLNEIISVLDEQIKSLQIEKVKIEKQVSSLNLKQSKEEVQKQLSTGIPVQINSFGGTLRDAPKIDANSLIKIPPNDTIMVFELKKEPYYLAKYKEYAGFISYVSFKENDVINPLLPEQRDYLVDKYGAAVTRRLRNREIWIGMTDEMAKISRGTPKDINRTRNAYGVSEQWIYGTFNNAVYLYFDNGILTTIQD